MKEYSATFITDCYVGYLSFNNDLLSHLTELLQTDNKGRILTTQIVTSTFKENLKDFSKLTNTQPTLYKFVNHFQKIPIGGKFLILKGKITDTLFLYKCQELISENKELSLVINKSCFKELFTNYNCLHYGETRFFAGEKDKKKRVCIFCGKTMPDVTFQKRAHIIPESIGNKTLFTYEECDNCNHNFGQLEQQWYNFTAPILTLYNIKGKEGSRIVKDKDCNIKNHDNHISFKVPILSKKMELEFSRYKYTQQNLYRCFSKAALCLLKREDLNNYSKTINWINGIEAKELPNIYIANTSHLYSQPNIVIYEKKSGDKSLPYIFCQLLFANICIVYLLPLKDGEVIDNEHFYSYLKKCFSYDFQARNFISDKSVHTPFSLTLNLPDGIDFPMM